MRLPILLSSHLNGGASGLIAQRVRKPLVCLGHLGQLLEIGAYIALKALLAMDAGYPILILSQQLPEVLTKDGLILRPSSGSDGSTDPLFGSCFVVVVLGFVPPLVCRSLIKSRSLETAFQPSATNSPSHAVDAPAILLPNPGPELPTRKPRSARILNRIADGSRGQ
jgi:hypothetical protein